MLFFSYGHDIYETTCSRMALACVHAVLYAICTLYKKRNITLRKWQTLSDQGTQRKGSLSVQGSMRG